MTAAAEPLQPPELEVGGKFFLTKFETTFEQDLHIMSVIREAGLDKLGAEIDFTTAEMSDIASRIIIKAFASGKLFDLLGAILCERGKEWSMDLARDQGLFFSRLKKPEDKKALHGAIVMVILGFFVSGLMSSKTSQVSLTPAQEYDAGQMQPKTEEQETSDSGDQSSESSPDSIPQDTTT
jgi:hypothetical protein